MASTIYRAELKCSHCQRTSSLDDSIDMYNQVIDEPGIFEVRSGDLLEADLEDIDSDFYLINSPAINEVACLELWNCPNCHKYNFAKIIFLLESDDILVKSIQATTLSPKLLNEIHYLTERINGWADTFVYKPIFTSLKPSQEEINKFKEALKQYHI